MEVTKLNLCWGVFIGQILLPTAKSVKLVNSGGHELRTTFCGYHGYGTKLTKCLISPKKREYIFVINYLIKRPPYKPSEDRNKIIDIGFMFLGRIEEEKIGFKETRPCEKHILLHC